jgi:hypothetical protein
MGYGVSTHGSCISIDADNVFHLLSCASLKPGLVKFRAHLLNEEGVLVAGYLRNEYATEGTAEIHTEIRASINGGNSIQFNSTISESKHNSIFDMALRADKKDRLRSHIRVDWNLTDNNNVRNVLDMQGYVREMLGDNAEPEELPVHTTLRYGMNAFSLVGGMKDVQLAASGDYDFTKHLTYWMNVQQLNLMLADDELFAFHAMMRSDRRPRSRDGQNHTADLKMDVHIVVNGTEQFFMEGQSFYGQEWNNR